MPKFKVLQGPVEHNAKTYTDDMEITLDKAQAFSLLSVGAIGPLEKVDAEASKVPADPPGDPAITQEPPLEPVADDTGP